MVRPMPQTLRRSHAARWLLIPAIFVAALPCHAVGTPDVWNFSVALDGRPIGTHRFELTGMEGEARSLRSEAKFEVKLLGFTAYRYRHHAEEQWQGNCLASINASTDDDGEVTAVNGRTGDNGFVVTASKGKKSSQAATQDCLLSFAYWNPARLALQRQLLDQGTGRIEAVTINALPAASIMMGGTSTAVTGLRIIGLKHPIDVWYTAAGLWAGLDTTVDGGRKLTYRLP